MLSLAAPSDDDASDGVAVEYLGWWWCWCGCGWLDARLDALGVEVEAIPLAMDALLGPVAKDVVEESELSVCTSALCGDSGAETLALVVSLSFRADAGREIPARMRSARDSGVSGSTPPEKLARFTCE